MNIMNGFDAAGLSIFADDWMREVEDAETLIRSAVDRFFPGSGIDGLESQEAVELAAVLRVCCNALASVSLSYRLTVGADGPGVADYLQRAADYKEMEDLNSLRVASLDKELALAGEERESFHASRMAALKLPVPLGIKTLRELLKGGNGNEA